MKKCTKTTSKKHIFSLVVTGNKRWNELYESEQEEVVKKCFACGLVDDKQTYIRFND